MPNVLVEVAIATYNHAQYISQALDSVLDQKTSFNFRIIVADDCSTDNTQNILKDYKRRYPSKIQIILREVNIGMDQGILRNGIRLLEACSAKYIAMLDGDDFWTNPLKLQKQVDFLENNDNYSSCAHNAQNKYEDFKRPNEFFNSKSINDKDYYFKDVLRYHNFPTASLVFRNKISLPNYFSNALAGDNSLYLFFSERGPIRYFSDVMSVYRHHSQGISKVNAKNSQLMLSNRIEFLDNFDADKNYKFTREIHGAKFHFYRRKVMDYLENGNLNKAHVSYKECLKSMLKSGFHLNRSEFKFLLVNSKLIFRW